MQIFSLILLSAPLCASFGMPGSDITVTSVETSTLVENVGVGQYTPEELKIGLSMPGTIKFADPNKHYWSCVDGRSTEPVFGTAGGDAGEFVAALSALLPYASEEQKAKPVGQLTTELFNKYIETEMTKERPFYLHTDEAGLTKAKEKLKCEDDSCVMLFPSPDDEEQVAQMQSDPEYMGCGHLKYMILKPELYGTDPKIVIAMIQAFFNYAFTQPESERVHFHIHNDEDGHEHHNEHAHGTIHTDDDGKEDFFFGPKPYGAQVNEVANKVLLAALPGKHEEHAILAVESVNEDIAADYECMAPMVRPNFIDPEAGYTQYFTAHSLGGTITGLRHMNTAFFVRELGITKQTEAASYALLEDWAKLATRVEAEINTFEHLKNEDGVVTGASVKKLGLDVADIEQLTLDDFIKMVNAEADKKLEVKKGKVDDTATSKLLETVAILGPELPIISAVIESTEGSLPRC